MEGRLLSVLDAAGGLLSVLDGDAEGGLLSTCAEGRGLGMLVSLIAHQSKWTPSTETAGVPDE